MDTVVPKNDNLRVVDARALFKKLWRMRARLGISRLTDLTELDDLGLPVISATRPVVDALQITATQGKGLRPIDSAVSAMMEAVERYSAAQPTSTIHGRAIDLSKVGNLKLLTPERLGAARLPKDAAIDWIEVRDLLSDEPVLMPAAEVLFPFYPSIGALRPVRPSTTGLSAGCSILEAVLHSLFEVIERDRISHFMQSGKGAKMLDLSTVKTPIEKRLLETFRSRNVRVLVCDLSEGAPIPVFLVCLISEFGIGPPMYMAGQGAHFSPQVALRRALLEAAQSRLVALQGSREDLVRHSSEYGNSWKKVNDDFDRLCRRVRLSGMSDFLPSRIRPKSIVESLESLTLLLAEGGYREIYYTDLTRKEIGMPVVHASVIGMVDSVVEPARKRCEGE